jgi:hypothetical protein
LNHIIEQDDDTRIMIGSCGEALDAGESVTRFNGFATEIKPSHTTSISIEACLTTSPHRYYLITRKKLAEIGWAKESAQRMGRCKFVAYMAPNKPNKSVNTRNLVLLPCCQETLMMAC